MKKAFTRLELLVVIALIAIAAALLFTRLTRVRPPGKKVFCLQNLQTVGIYCLLYANDNASWPGFNTVLNTTSGEALAALYPSYVPILEVFSDPGHPTDPVLGTSARNGWPEITNAGYVFDAASAPGGNDPGVPSTADAMRAMMICAGTNHHGTPLGANVLFVDGHVEFVEAARSGVVPSPYHAADANVYADDVTTDTTIDASCIPDP